MLPNTGNEFPIGRQRPSEADYARCISEALRSELGTTRAATKTVMRWTGSSDHTARNWINGIVGPSGYHLVCLARESLAVTNTMLRMANRPELMLSLDIHAAEVALAKAMGALEILRRQQKLNRGREN
jgi:hypothetical protein